MKKLIAFCLLPFAFCLLPFALKAQAPRTMNAAEIQLALKKLGTLCSVLHIAAHPDDENTALLAYMANERLCRTGYLSLTRGEGGQNLIGSEKGALLGVIRTQELLAARRIDGAEQFFTRAIDFGFSKTAEESLRLWNKQEVLSDVVWVIRKFRPDVVITRFPPDERAGHGHHQASAILAAEAFKLAGDAKAFPDQLKFVSIWQPKRLLWNSFVRQGDTAPADALKVDVGAYNPLLGKSYTEIAAQSRSQHKSQGFGSAERRGSRIEHLTHVDGERATKDIFDDVETSWKRIEGGENIGKLIEEINTKFNPENSSAIVPNLLHLYDDFSRFKDVVYSETIPPNRTNTILFDKRKEIVELIRFSAGFWLEAIAKEPTYAIGDLRNEVNLTAINRSDFPFKLYSSSLFYETVLHNPTTNKLEDTTIDFQDANITEKILNKNESHSIKGGLYLEKDDLTTHPYWLTGKNAYLANILNQKLLRSPENLPALAIFRFNLEGKEFSFKTPISFRYVNRVNGEIYRPFVIAPPVVVNLAEPLYVFPNGKAKRVRVTVRNNAAETNGVLKFNLPAGWEVVPNEFPVQLKEKGAEFTATLNLAAAPQAQDGRLEAFVEANGQKYANSQITIDYPHIPQQTLFPPAEARLVKLDVKTGKERIGYIVGSGDEIPESLRQIGYDVRLIADEDFDSLDFTKEFDTIIAGIRAYNTRDVLRRKNQKLLDFVRDGGTFVVQYNTTDNTLFQNFAPFPLKLSNQRVTVEEAPVKFLQSAHAALNFPNKITDKDFTGWVQERGTYFASEWDKSFTPILAMNDPNEPERQGSLLVAQHGKGKFVYTGIAFFRQLPAGVPGAYRLFVNLISNQSARNGKN